MSSSPRVLFGMAAYNRPDALPQTLESLLSQTFTDFAIVIVDDRPTPDVRAIVESYKRWGKACGAGGGGALVLYASSEGDAVRLRAALREAGVAVIDFAFDFGGLVDEGDE